MVVIAVLLAVDGMIGQRVRQWLGVSRRVILGRGTARK